MAIFSKVRLSGLTPVSTVRHVFSAMPGRPLSLLLCYGQTLRRELVGMVAPKSVVFFFESIIHIDYLPKTLLLDFRSMRAACTCETEEEMLLVGMCNKRSASNIKLRIAILTRFLVQN